MCAGRFDRRNSRCVAIHFLLFFLESFCVSTNEPTDGLRPHIDTRPKPNRRSWLSEYLYELILAVAALAVISLVALLMRLQG